MDIVSISTILESSIDSLSDDIKKRVLEFLEFLKDPKKDRFVVKCGEVKKVKGEIDNGDLYQLIGDAQYNFQGRIMRTPNKNSFRRTVDLFRKKKIPFTEVLDIVSLIGELKYSDFIEIIHITRNTDEVTFGGIQSLLGKLEDPSKTTEENLLGIRELDIIALISINDNSSGDQSKLILQLAKIFGVTPDESLMSKVETLKKRTP